METTPIAVIANVTRIVSKVVDRLTGDRSDYPLLVAAAASQALRNFGIESRVMYGQVAWVEVMENNTLMWAGCWGESFHFWVATQYGEVVDLNTSVAFRKHGHATPHLKAQYSPPMLWSVDVPNFYRYKPEGVAELELTDPRDQHRFQLVVDEINAKCRPELIAADEDPEFANEPILVPGRKLLDDTAGTFKLFDRALAVQGVPEAPF